MTVSIIIAAKTWQKNLEECVGKCRELDFPDFEIIILPDAPFENRNCLESLLSDRGIHPERSEGPSKLGTVPIRIIPTGRVSPAQKRDIAMSYATGEILAFIDDDAYPAKDWLKNAVKNFLDPQVAAVGGPAITPESDNLRQKASGLVYSSFIVSGNYVYRYLPMKRHNVDDYPTCNFIVRKSIMQELGGFKTNFWPGEDSLPPDEDVLIVNQLNEIERVKIGNLVDKHLKDPTVYKDRKSEVSYENPENITALSFNSDYKIRSKPIKAFIRHRKFHEVYELKLTRGNKIKLTGSHSLFTFSENGEIVPMKVKELKVGDLIVTPRKITVLKDIRKINAVQLFLSLEDKFIYDGKSALYLRSKEYIFYLLKYYKEELLGAINKYNLKGNINNWKYYGYLPLIALRNLPPQSYDFRLLKKFKVKIRARGHGNVVSMKPIIFLDEDLLWFLGFMCAEGWIDNPSKTQSANKWNLSFNQRAKNRIVLDRARKILQSHLGLSFRLYKDKRYNTLNLIVNCRVLWCFLWALGFKGYSYEKRVPPLIFSLSRGKIKAFLDGYHAGDPCDYTDGRLGKMGITTSLPEMAKDFALLFLRLGEPFRITRHKENRKSYYHDQFNIHTFCPSVKKLGINTHLRMLENLRDGIPAIDFLLKIAKNYHLTSKLITNRVTPQYRNPRDNRKKVTWYHIRRFTKIVKQLVGNVVEVKKLEKILDSDLRFEEILEIKKIRNQPRYTYDLSVGGNPGSDNFIAGTFICAHNTKLCLDLTKNLCKKIIYDPQVIVYHHRRPLFMPHIKQIANYALHRGYFVKRYPQTSLRLPYFIPALFLFILVIGGIFSAFSGTLRAIYFWGLSFYLLLVLIFSVSADIWLTPLVFCGIILTHITYGLYFLKGLISGELKEESIG